MKNIINKKIIGSIMLVMIISICQIIFFQIPSASAGTAQPVELTLEVPFSKANAVIKFNTGDTSQLAGYIKQIYNYAIGAVAILAAIMLMVGGLMWIVSGGNTNTVGEAKTIIGASLSGLVLVMTSYLILYQVNPSLVLLSRDISPIGAINSCNWTTPVALLNTGASQQGQAAPADATSVTVYGCPLSTEKKADSSCSAKKTDANSLCCCASKTAAAATTAAATAKTCKQSKPECSASYAQGKYTQLKYDMLDTTSPESLEAKNNCPSVSDFYPYCCCIVN